LHACKSYTERLALLTGGPDALNALRAAKGADVTNNDPVEESGDDVADLAGNHMVLLGSKSTSLVLPAHDGHFEPYESTSAPASSVAVGVTSVGALPSINSPGVGLSTGTYSEETLGDPLHAGLDSPLSDTAGSDAALSDAADGAVDDEGGWLVSDLAYFEQHRSESLMVLAAIMAALSVVAAGWELLGRRVRAKHTPSLLPQSDEV
jgi:hypothetical protein